MVDDVLTGMIGYRRFKKRGANPRTQTVAQVVDRFIKVIGRVGPTYYLVRPLDQRHAVIVDVDSLMPYAWFETEEDARRGGLSELEEEDV